MQILDRNLNPILEDLGKNLDGKEMLEHLRDMILEKI